MNPNDKPTIDERRRLKWSTNTVEFALHFGLTYFGLYNTAPRSLEEMDLARERLFGILADHPGIEHPDFDMSIFLPKFR